MKVEKREGGTERRILTGMIVSEPVLSRIAAAWTKDGLFRSRYANIVGGWCVHHAVKYNGKAPGKAIQAYFESWAEESKEKDEIKLVESLLSTLSGEYSRLKKEVNPDHVIDLAGDHFNRVSLEKLAEGIQADLESGQVQKAAARRDKHKPLELGAGEWIDVFKDEAAFEKVFADRQEPLVTFRGDLGEFFGNAFERDSFVAIQGPEKSAKSYLLQEICWQGVKQGRKVVMFQVGDLSQSQIMARFMVRAAGRPWEAKDDIRYPISLTLEDGSYRAKYKIKRTKKPMDRDVAREAWDKVVSDQGGDSLFRLSCHPNTSITINGVNDYLERWDRDGWTADVVCLAEGSLVLTDKGLVPIEKVTKLHRLWDGLNWVSHDGPICKGVKDVIEYQGVTATPDHLFWSQGQWRTLESCRRLGLPLAQTGVGRHEIRLGENRVAPGTGQTRKIQVGQGYETAVRFGALQEMQEREVVPVVQSQERYRSGMPAVLATEAVSYVALFQNGSGKAAVRESELQRVEALRSQRHQVSFLLSNKSVLVGAGSFGTATERSGVGPNRQRWPLRAREHSLVYEEAEHIAHQEAWGHAEDAQVPHVAPGDQVFRFDVAAPVGEAQADSIASGVPLESQSQAVRKSRVWDILNAGPLHRFTVQGFLAHNCIDYADILAPVSGTAESRDQINMTWKLMRRMSQDWHCCVLTATQTDAASYESSLIRRKNFSEDKRKYSHVTALFGNNQTDDEKTKGMRRLNWIELRERDFVETKCVTVVGCLDVANPMIKSAW